MYPHERSLVERMKGRPFAIVGVNSDANRDDLKRVMVQEKITWRSFWDGGSPSGPIASRWNVSGWPTVYVIDHLGVIRSRDIQGSSLDKMVDQLVKQAEAAREGKARP
jgi:hypothetical protein